MIMIMITIMMMMMIIIILARDWSGATLLMHLGITHISLITNDHFEVVDMFITSLLTDNL